ncbi:hypothetical protein RRG08_033936 [Elysia crispata]|uniref:Uncharacterized protein n=1 Tax=Elysia crispata TaxID=231223 RepID=A0AAE0YBE3_9GAST|nr:hypothetical protein RRG08_033936 [Elysia crispata]
METATSCQVYHNKKQRQEICDVYYFHECQILYGQHALHGKKKVWFIIGWYQDNWYKVEDNRHICTMDQLKEAVKGPFITESTILHQEPRLTEVGMVTAQQFTEPLDTACQHA